MKSKDNYSGFKKIIKFITTVFSWTILVILIILALFLAYYTIGNKLAEKSNSKFEPFISLFTIISPSMTPNINVGDVVVDKRIKSPQDIKVGDVITFISTSSISRGMTITHRVTEIGTDESGYTYKTKGDNNLSPDSAPAKYNNVIGKVIFRIPKLGQLQNLLANKGGWLLIIVVPALFIIISDIIKVFKLANVKNKIEKIDQSKEKNKREKMQQEELRKEILKKRLLIEKNENEPEPIKTKKDVRIVVAEQKELKKNFQAKNKKSKRKR